MSHHPLHPQLASQARRSILPLAAISLTCMLPQAQAGKVIIGAADNTAGGPRSVVAGGKNNTSTAGFAFIGAGAVVTKDIPNYALVMGNPAKQHGWMSAFGHRLHFDDNGLAVCPESGEQYELRNHCVRPIESAT